MNKSMSKSKRTQPSRREFLQQTGAAAGLLALGLAGGCAQPQRGQNGNIPAPDFRGVALASDPNDPVASSQPARWALQHLRDTLIAKGMPVRLIDRWNDAADNELCIVAAGSTSS